METKWILCDDCGTKIGATVSKKLKWHDIESQFKSSLPLFWCDCLKSAVLQGQCQDCKVGGPNLWACLEVRRHSQRNKRGSCLGPWRLTAGACDFSSFCNALICLKMVLFPPRRTAARMSAAANLTRTTAPCTRRWGRNWAAKIKGEFQYVNFS